MRINIYSVCFLFLFFQIILFSFSYGGRSIVLQGSRNHSTVLGIDNAVPNQVTCNMRNIQILNFSNLFKPATGREFRHLRHRNE